MQKKANIFKIRSATLVSTTKGKLAQSTKEMIMLPPKVVFAHIFNNMCSSCALRKDNNDDDDDNVRKGNQR